MSLIRVRIALGRCSASSAAEHEVQRAERGAERAEHFFHFRRHKDVAEPDAAAPES